MLGPELLNTNICTAALRNERVARGAMGMMQQSGTVSSRSLARLHGRVNLFYTF